MRPLSGTSEATVAPSLDYGPGRSTRGSRSSHECHTARFPIHSRVRLSESVRQGELRGARGIVVAWSRGKCSVELDDLATYGRFAGEWVDVREAALDFCHEPRPPRRGRKLPRFSPNTPPWVRQLVLAVLDAHSESLAEFEWAPKPPSTTPRVLGRMEPGRVRIMNNGSAAEQKRTVLHELAHVLSRPRGHTQAFWNMYWMLIRDFGGDIEHAYAVCPKRSYSRGALTAFQRIFGQGANADASVGRLVRASFKRTTTKAGDDG
jgi:hypothetical protein